MRRRRERGSLASLLPLLALIGLAQGVSANHHGMGYHRRSRLREPTARQIGADVEYLRSGDLLASATSTSLFSSQPTDVTSTVTVVDTFAVASALASPGSALWSSIPAAFASETASSSTPKALGPSQPASPSAADASPTSSSSIPESSTLASAQAASLLFAEPSPNVFSLNVAVVPSSISTMSSLAAPTSDFGTSSSYITGGYVRPNTPGQPSPSATPAPIAPDQVPAAFEPSSSINPETQVVSGSASDLSPPASTTAANAAPVTPESLVSIDHTPPTTLLAASQTQEVGFPGVTPVVSSGAAGASIDNSPPISIGAEIDSSSVPEPVITGEPSFLGVSIDTQPPTTLFTTPSAVVEPIESPPGPVISSSMPVIDLPAQATSAQEVLPVSSAFEFGPSPSVTPSDVQPSPEPVESSSTPVESSIIEPSAAVGPPSSSFVEAPSQVDAQPSPTPQPASSADIGFASAPSSSLVENTPPLPEPSSSRVEPEVPGAPGSSSTFPLAEPSVHSLADQASPSAIQQPSPPADIDVATTTVDVRPTESSSADVGLSPSQVIQPSPHAAADELTTASATSIESSLPSASALATPSASMLSSQLQPEASSSASLQQAIPSSSDIATQPSLVDDDGAPSISYSSDDWAAQSSSSSTKEDIYVPPQTWLIVAPSPSSAPVTSATPTTTTQPLQTGSATTPQLPSTAVIPNSVPTLIVPANSAANKQGAGTGRENDPLKDTTLISLLLAADQYPWTFVVKSADATSQLFNTFPKVVSGALQVPEGDVQTYGLQVYQPASWNGDQATLLTQWLAYIPEDKFDELNAYLKAGQAGNSPLFNQTGIQGDLAAQINTAFPLAANSETAPSTTSTQDSDNDNTRTRDIIIGVCVGIGGLLWLGLVFWIYKRIKRNNDRAVHKRLSEHMSMFDERERDQRRFSTVAPSLAPSDIDDRPSSFYASPLENDPAFRRQQRQSLDGDSARYDGSLADSGHSDDMSQTYHPSVFGNSWFANPQGQGGQQMRQTQPQNPFEDIVTRSYLHTSGSSGGVSGMAQRRSGPGKPVHKAMIGQPTLHASSLEFREQ